MKVDELLTYLKGNGEALRKNLLEGSYTPKPVRRVEIPKPDGGVRLLGIPTVVDRIIQQAIAQEYMKARYKWVVDIDLAKYFDTVNHDMLMALVAREVVETDRGCPQGRPISPLLSNIMLNELDKELERRNHKFCRYADDNQLYVKSKKAANRVMVSITTFIEEELKLKVNKEKSAVDRPWKRKFLGYSFYLKKADIRIRIHPKSVKKVKDKAKEITSRSNAWSIES